MRKKVISMLCGFLVLMLLFTILSRAAASMGVPKVGTTNIQNMMIAHKVTAAGKVIQNREQAVSTEVNQVIKMLYVNEGQQVEAGDVLFEVDMEELKEQILSAKQEIEKQKLQAGDNKSSKEVSAARKALEQNQASSDYTEAVNQGDRAVQKAAEELEAAKQALEAYKDNGSASSADGVEETLKKTVKEKEEALQEAKDAKSGLEKEIEAKISEMVQVPALAETDPGDQGEELSVEGAGSARGLDQQQAEAEVRAEYKSALTAANAKVETAEKELEEANQALEAYQQNQAMQAENGAKATKEQLKQAVNEKQTAYEEIIQSRDSSIRTAGKTVDSANLGEASDSAAQVAAIDLEQKELALSKLEKLEQQKGRITSPIKGVVTKVAITTGDRTPDGTAVLLADLTSGNKFVAQISADDEKYVARKDMVTLTAGSSKKTIEAVEIDSVKVNEENKDLLDVTINLPSDTLEMGVAATMEVEKKSAIYKSCVPLSAVYYDNSQAYVLVADESETVLGTEQTARRIDVVILEKNEDFAALQDGTLTSDQKLISSSDRSVEPGGRIRLEE